MSIARLAMVDFKISWCVTNLRIQQDFLTAELDLGATALCLAHDTPSYNAAYLYISTDRCYTIIMPLAIINVAA
jgi:hypothetical protein